ncbi:hypothetical protein ACLOJK_035631 [Asimina triloba]
MTDGGGESGRGNGDDCDQKTASGADDFGRSVARIAVAQICESVGFQRFQKSALEAFSDIGIRYLREIGKVARSHANHTGRTTCNVFDVVQGLEDLSLSLGFSGASDPSRCLACSGVVRDVELFVRFSEEIPFVRPLPKFPVIRNRKRTLSFAQIGEAPGGRHIPSWLPAFPNPSSYGRVPMRNDKAVNCMDETEQAWRRKNGERLVLRSWPAFGDSGINKPTITAQFKKKDALSNGMVDKNELSMAEISVPRAEVESSAFCNLDDNDRRVLPQERSPVNFRFQSNKKALAAPVNLSSSRKDVEKIAYWFSMDDEEDGKQGDYGT